MLESGGLGFSHIRKKFLAFRGWQCLKAYELLITHPGFSFHIDLNEGEICIYLASSLKEDIFILKGLNLRVTFSLELGVTLLVPTKAGCGFGSRD